MTDPKPLTTAETVAIKYACELATVGLPDLLNKLEDALGVRITVSSSDDGNDSHGPMTDPKPLNADQCEECGIVLGDYHHFWPEAATGTEPIRNMMMPEAWYTRLDAGIRFPVRVLHAAGIETCQSCEGGSNHAYTEPSIDLLARADDASGFAALHALEEYGLHVAMLSIVWNVRNGLPYEKLWRIVLSKKASERADDRPIFIRTYRAVQ